MNILTIVAITACLFITQPVLAADTATQSAQEIESENLKQRLQDVIKDKLDSAEDTIKNKQAENSLVGYTGIINKISNLSLVVNTTQNNLLQVITSEDTNIVKNGKEIKASSLSIDEKIIIIGNLDTEDILNAKRLIAISNTPAITKRQTVVGPISNLDQKTLSFSIKELNIDIPKKSTIDPEDLQDNQTVIVIIETDIEDQTNTLLSLQSLLQ
jgi:hypothetical protein